MLAIQNRQYLSVIATTGADIHASVTYSPSGNGRGHTLNKLTAITAISASPGTAILGKLADATSPAIPDSAQVSLEISSINIRNIDTTSQTVTVCIVEADDAGTQTVYQLYKETIASGQELVYTEGAGWALATHSTIGSQAVYIAPADVTNNTNDVLANITGLTADVISGQVYEFEAVVPFTTSAATCGLRVTVNGPAMTHVRYKSVYPLSATTQTTNHLSALQGPAAANADTVSGVATVQGEFKPSADGTFAIQFASESAAAGTITALAGSILKLRRVL